MDTICAYTKMKMKGIGARMAKVQICHVRDMCLHKGRDRGALCAMYGKRAGSCNYRAGFSL